MKKILECKTEKDCIEWVMVNTPILITPLKIKKYPLVSPFSSLYAFEVIYNHLGKELFNQLNQ